MKTIVYLVRHSEEFKGISRDVTRDNLQLCNEKGPLSVFGEKKAELLGTLEYFDNIKNIYSSSYVRAISTAKYLATKLNLNINIVDDLGEREFGFTDWSEMPVDFGVLQYNDFSYKVKNGECLEEVRSRMKNAILDIVNKNLGKEVLIVSHSTAMLSYFTYFCDKGNSLGELLYKNKVIASGRWNAPEIYKLEFEGNDLINLELIRPEILNR